MEIKTNIELLNEISAKLGGKSDASVLVEGLNNIANALGDTDPDQMVTVSQALETVLDHMDGGGGGGVSNPVLTITLVNNLPDPGGPIPLTGVPIEGVKLESGAITICGIMAAFDGGTATGDFLVPRSVVEDTEEYAFNSELSLSGAGSVEGSNAVNCELMGNFILVTDPSANASITVTITE